MKVVSKLKTDLFSDTVRFVSLGKLDPKMIDFISCRKPELKEILSSTQDIVFWEDRIKHTERHKNDFISDNEYLHCFENIPNIIHNPDYISVHPKDNSISFIKNFSAHVSIAIKVSNNGKLFYRTMYPITDAQLSHYMRRGLAWKYKAT